MEFQTISIEKTTSSEPQQSLQIYRLKGSRDIKKTPSSANEERVTQIELWDFVKP